MANEVCIGGPNLGDNACRIVACDEAILREETALAPRRANGKALDLFEPRMCGCDIFRLADRAFKLFVQVLPP
jgi:hypothetical protein